MAERNTAAVDVASATAGSEETSPPASAPKEPKSASRPEKASTTTERSEDSDGSEEKATADGRKPHRTPAGTKGAPSELHSGHKLARRYRLEECTTRLDGFSSWRAVDEKLRRAVGVHLLPSGHSRARAVLDAARSSALLGDPRFVQVLDAVEEGDMVYVVHEWLPDAVPLTEVLAAGPLEPYDAYQLAHQVGQAMASAHREGLAHLRLTPGAVLRTGSGQYRIRGLAVNAALRGITDDRPERVDTEAIGALLYAALTQRWPYERDAYGLTGVGGLAGGTLPPDQVRAGVHRGLSDVAMRALVNKGATAASQDPPCTTPQELVTALTELPRIKAPEPEFPAAYQRREYPPYARGAYSNKPAAAAAPREPVVAAPAPTLPGRTGKALKWGVSALLIAALGLGSWQVADALMNGGGPSGGEQDADDSGSDDKPKQQAAGSRLTIQDAREYYPDGRPQAADKVALSYDGDPKTHWNTKSFQDGPATAPYKDGVGIVYDLGKAKKISSVSLNLRNSGEHTEIALYAPDSLAPSSGPGSLPRIGAARTTGASAAVKLKKPVESRYVLVWLTAMPHSGSDGFSSAGYKQGISHVVVKGS
ncbi:protein kinase family protein [Streptomyces sp. P38-E01]|uniref:Protein kinase family protein n=1 Tax=Streptomyces tardus TaxID=2780544 RepID=A0A949JF40_9ACTN|nr:protein kinase family protein [Streptomyces tardus]MBU7597793.1 protein kinase family protein [Streptomyces tardus]